MYFLLRGLKDRAYLRHFRERLGFLPGPFRQTAGGAIWLHAVSVGEVLSSVELVRRLRAQFPLAPLFVSTTTVAGRLAAEQQLSGSACHLFYAPIDYCFAVRGVLRVLRPRAVVVLETEIWPNLYRETKRSGAALLVVNGRISDRAAPRYRALRWFFRTVLALPDAILAQSEVSFRRYLELGAPPAKTQFSGNLKYDFSPGELGPPAAIGALIERLRPKQIWIAASTMPPAEPGDPDENEAVLAAFGELAPRHPGLLLILVPRKPERFDAASELLRRTGSPFLRRSSLGAGDMLPLPGVLLLDSIGELGSLFALADVVFMGGTLARRGGHNLLEPAFFGRPIITGPHLENFPEIARKFSQGGALFPIDDAGGLRPAVEALLNNAELRERLGFRARELAESERGATERAVSELRRRYWQAVPCRRRPAPERLALWPLSRLWLLGGRLKAVRDRASSSRLETPVVSVGGLTVGGTGKTPAVLWLAGRLKEAGLLPAVLTRGYRRRAAEGCTILAPGQHAPPWRTGDEPQIYLRAAVGPIGIGADRAAAGRLIEQRFRPDVFLLDDGFQHLRLERDVDIVVIDALEPFGGGEVFPLGRLREPLEALGRAGIVLVTRVEPGQQIDGIEAVIRRFHPQAQVFTSRVAGESWVPGPPPARAGAFCGLGNPDSFWQTLQAMRIEPAFRRAFPDHHRYTPRDLEHLKSAGVEALLTTEKDLVNLPEGWEGRLAPVRLFWLKIGLEINQADAFFAAVETRLSRSSRNCLRSNPPP